MKKSVFAGVLTLAASLAGQVAAEELDVICSNDQRWCDLMANSFEEATGVDVRMVRKSTGETLAQARAEKGNPKFDVWWGGTGDPHLIAAAEGLTQPSDADTTELLGWAKNMARISENRAIGVHAGALGISFNSEFLAKKGIAPPACWKDLAHPRFEGEIQVANPNSSGTAYTQLATLVQIFGEDPAFSLLIEIGKNVNSYTKSGSAPNKAVARGETGVAVGFMHDMVTLQKAGFPLEIVSPCEGTGYEVGAVSIIEGARNVDAAKKWVEFVLRGDIQALAAEAKVYNVPSNSLAPLDEGVPSLDTVKLIDYDFETFGASATRNRLLKRWDDEVKPKGE